MKCASFIKSLFFYVKVISSTYRIHLPRPLSKVIYESEGKKRKTKFRRDNGSGLNQGIYCIFRKIRFLPTTETRPLFPYYRKGEYISRRFAEQGNFFLRIDRDELFI